MLGKITDRAIKIFATLNIGLLLAGRGATVHRSRDFILYTTFY